MINVMYCFYSVGGALNPLSDNEHKSFTTQARECLNNFQLTNKQKAFLPLFNRIREILSALSSLKPHRMIDNRKDGEAVESRFLKNMARYEYIVDNNGLY